MPGLRHMEALIVGGVGGAALDAVSWGFRVAQEPRKTSRKPANVPMSSGLHSSQDFRADDWMP